MTARSNGFTLIETIVVVSILMAVSLTAVFSIIRFQKDTLLNDTVSEFVSVAKQAQSNSLSGKVLNGEEVVDFDADGLPEYGVEISASQYRLFRDYIPAGETTIARETLESYTIHNSITVSPVPSEVIFDRLSGTSPALTLTFTNSPNETRQVDITNKGLITYQTL